MRKIRILSFVLVLIMVFVLASCKTHTHIYSELIDEVPATCEQDGVKAHYTCSGCDKLFDEFKEEIEDVVIPALGHDYVHHDAVEASLSGVGTAEHYSCSRCDKLFVKDGEEYKEVEAASLVIPELVGSVVPAKEASFFEPGCVEHILVEGETNRYFVMEGDKYVEVEASAVLIAKKELKEVKLNAEAKTSFDLGSADEAAILDQVVFDVVATDETTVQMKATEIVEFATTPGMSRTFTFKYAEGENVLFEKEVTLDLYRSRFVIAEPGHKFADGDQILFVNINGRAMANALSYVGYEAGSSGSTKITMEEAFEKDKNGADIYRYANIYGAEDVAVLTLYASNSIDGTFYVRRADDMNLCGGMGYTQWYIYSDNNSLPMSFELTIRDDYTVIAHGQQFNYSYLRVWNRYGADLDAFFITNSATYGDDYYIYVGEKDYTGCAHEYSELVAGRPATCEETGMLDHYTCSQCGGYFDAEYNKLASPVIPALGHAYQKHEEIAATPESTGVKEYYSCGRCSDIFLLVDGNYVKVTAEDIIIPKLEAQFVEAKTATFAETGYIAHYELTVNGETIYYVKENDAFTTKSLAEITLAKKTYAGGAVAVAEESQKQFDVYGLDAQKVLDGIVLDVVAEDESIVKVHANAIEGFNEELIGDAFEITLAYELDGAELFKTTAIIAVYEVLYQLVEDASTFAAGDVILFANVNTRVMANFLSYAGYKAGSSGSTLVMGRGEHVISEELTMPEYLSISENEQALTLTLIDSVEVAGTFYLSTPNDILLCGGMGYTQWLPYSAANGRAQSFTLTINDVCGATIHGNQYNFSYLRVWNRYANADDAFFITNSATYGDNIYIYRQVKSYAAHTEHTTLKHVEAVEPTCTSTGNVEYWHCPINGKNYDADSRRIADVVIPMVEHTYSELQEYLAPTCEEAGHIAYYECEVCHQFFNADKELVTNVVIEPNGHSQGELKKAKEADCTREGNIAYYECSECHQLFDAENNKIETATIAALGHEYGELIAGYAATCTEFGMVDHYKCDACGQFFNSEKQHITSPLIDMHTYGEDGKCTVCGHDKPLSVSEAKGLTDNSLVTVRGVLVGFTGNYDGGYVYVLIKDLLTNETVGIRKQIVNDKLDNEERLFGKGYSYAPAMYFEIGDVVEIPVTTIVNSATKGGETAKTIFAYRGISFTNENAKELVALYKVGHIDDYRYNLDETVTVIDNQEKLEAFCLSTKPQYKMVCIKGTEEQPLKILTHAATTAAQDGKDMSRQYLFLYYDEASSLADLRVNGAAPVLSNFGNQFNLLSGLSSILFGQADYADWNFSKPNYFVGEIYCMMVGGSTAYYHFVVMNQGDIYNESFDGPIPIAAKAAYNEFYDYQEANLAKMNITPGKDITTAVGVTGVVCCEDMVKFGALATQNPTLASIWSKEKYSTSYINNEGKTVNITVNHAVLELAQCKKWIKPNYTIIGSKSGWLNNTTDSRPYKVCNCLVAVEGPDGTVMVGYVYNKRSDNGDDSVYYYLNILYQILIALYEGRSTKALEAQLACDSCAGVIIPNDGSVTDDADFFSENSQYIHFAMNAKELITTASTWKTFTGLTCCRYFTEEELDMKVTVLGSDLNSIDSTPSFKGGEVITLRDALHFMMLPSSNICPSVIARVVGTDLIQQKMEAL